MPRQNALVYTGLCGCRFSFRLEPGSTPVYLDDEDVRTEHLQRIAAGDPTANPNPFVSQARVCPEHKALGYSLGQELCDVVCKESQYREYTFAEAEKIIPGLSRDNYNPSFDAQRHVLAKFNQTAVSLAQSNQIQAACDARFGAGKVVVSRQAVVIAPQER